MFLINGLKFIRIVERVPLISAHLLLSTALLLVLNTHKMHLTVRSLATSIADSENHNSFTVYEEQSADAGKIVVVNQLWFSTALLIASLL